jgi:hypothetical protein
VICGLSVRPLVIILLMKKNWKTKQLKLKNLFSYEKDSNNNIHTIIKNRKSKKN